MYKNNSNNALYGIVFFASTHESAYLCIEGLCYKNVVDGSDSYLATTL
jgi:hypothetical protein